jgi:hypothetical protein
MDLLSDEEVAEREALMERDELADKGSEDEPENVIEHNEWEDEGPEPVRAGDVCGEYRPQSI